MKVTAMKNVHSRAAGFSLIEVMIAVVVLAFGLISLAALQGRLFQSGAESKARAAATSIAQQSLEDARSFAFVTPPTGYTGPTYISLAGGGPWTFNAGGVAFTATRTVKRYRYVDANPADATPGTFAEDADTTNTFGNFSGGVPEFKQVGVTVGWTGSDGQPKAVLMTDSVAAVAPADAAMLRKLPSEATGGPQVWIEPPNKDNPQVVPIGIGGGQSAASSNPKPEQFVKSDAAVTRFSVMTFTGSDPTQVLLNRKVDVSVATCVCQSGGTSSAINPTYQSTIWNGMQQAYVDPQALPSGTPIGTPVVGDSEIEPTCTVCCRDHHENEKRKQPNSQRPDPYRMLTGVEAGGNEHYGYKTGDNLYDIGSGLFPVAETGGRYVDSCQIIRVGGRLRMATDAMQNSLVVTPLNSLTTGYRISGFANSYANYVTSSITAGMAALPTGYLAPTARFPGPDTTVQATYSGIVDPAPIALATGETVPLVAFGLYVDYLSPETLKAYQCARDNDTSSGCAGLGALDPLQVLPFYAVNLANLGAWISAKPEVASVVDAGYDKGLLASDGGLVTAQKDGSNEPFPVTIGINNSNSGLAGSNPVDPDDGSALNYVRDAQTFTKVIGSSGGQARTLTVQTVKSSTLAIRTLKITSPDAICSSGVCTYSPPASSVQLQIGDYSEQPSGQNKPVTDRKVCLPADSRISTPSVSGNGTTADTTTFVITGPLNQEYTLAIAIIAEADSCNLVTTGLLLTP